MNGAVAFFKTIGGPRLAAMIAVGVGLIGFFAFMIMRISEPLMSPLYTEVTLSDSSSIVRQLESQNIPYELRNEGSTILVPKDKVLQLRMQMAEQGLPTGGSVGYEIFDKGDTLGATSFVQNLNHLRALEGELARTIAALRQVRIARVHLVLPKKQLFSEDKTEPSASIVLSLRGRLDKSQIKAIQNLVASGVKDLTPSRVSIVDDSGNLLANGADDDSNVALSNSIDERNIAFQNRLKTQINEIVTSVVGPNNARVQVTAEVDYNRITQTSDTYDPEGQVVRSTQTREKSLNAANGETKSEVSVAGQLPNEKGSEDKAKSTSTENNNTVEEVVNYEISRTTKTEVIEAGRIKRLSVAVLVDGIYNKDKDGKIAYQPRPQAEIDQISTLVRSAIGFDKARGDQVEVVNIRFAPPVKGEQLEAGEASLFNFSKSDYFQIAEIAVLLIVSILVLFLVVRPLIKRIVTPEEPAEVPELEGLDPQIAAAIAEANGGKIPEEVKALMAPGENKSAALIDVAQMAGEMHEETVGKVGEMVKNNPDEAVAIIRQWLSQEAA